MAQSTLSNYWRLVLAKAGLEFDFYICTRHACCHYLWTELELAERDIEYQMGWAQGGAKQLLKVYGHREQGALERIHGAYAARGKVTPLLRKVKDA
jgi:hypothetical protein